MKQIKLLRAGILVLVVAVVFSCSSNDDAEIKTVDLIGEWQRSDFNNEFEYRLIFHPGNSGYRTQREGALDGQPISNAISFTWDTIDNILTIDYDGNIVTTTFFIDANGQLHLSDITDLYFIKL